MLGQKLYPVAGSGGGGLTLCHDPLTYRRDRGRPFPAATGLVQCFTDVIPSPLGGAVSSKPPMASILSRQHVTQQVTTFGSTFGYDFDQKVAGLNPTLSNVTTSLLALEQGRRLPNSPLYVCVCEERKAGCGRAIVGAPVLIRTQMAQKVSHLSPGVTKSQKIGLTLYTMRIASSLLQNLWTTCGHFMLR